MLTPKPSSYLVHQNPDDAGVDEDEGLGNGDTCIGPPIAGHVRDFVEHEGKDSDTGETGEGMEGLREKKRSVTL